MTMKELEKRFHSKYDKCSDGCWLWSAFIASNGYGHFFYKNKKMGAHRASWLLHYGSIPEGKCVCHMCDVRHCVNPEHLFIGGQSENINDAVRKNRWHRAKLTTDDVRKIRQSEERPTVLAKEFHVCYETIFRVKSFHSWRNI